jgi:DNA-directed RNA polymerase specialized sigma24 family protein
VPPFRNSAVVRALGALPPAQREAVVLTRYLDLTDEQAAEAMRVSQAALRRHLAAGKAALREVLAHESDPPGPLGGR